MGYFDPHIIGIIPYIKQQTRVLNTAHLLFAFMDMVVPLVGVVAAPL